MKNLFWHLKMQFFIKYSQYMAIEASHAEKKSSKNVKLLQL